MADNPIRPVGGKKTYATVTITTEVDGLSNVIDLGGLAPRSIEMSSAWTTANLTFMGAVSSTDRMKSVRTSTAGLETTHVTTVGYVLALNPDNFAGLRYLQARSGSTTTPVAQAAARALYLGLTGVDECK